MCLAVTAAWQRDGPNTCPHALLLSCVADTRLPCASYPPHTHTHTGASYKVSYASASQLGSKAAGEVAAEGVTDGAGAFVTPALPGDATYSVEMSKTGYVLTPAAPDAQPDANGVFRFAAKQLAQVRECVLRVRAGVGLWRCRGLMGRLDGGTHDRLYSSLW